MKFRSVPGACIPFQLASMQIFEYREIHRAFKKKVNDKILLVNITAELKKKKIQRRTDIENNIFREITLFPV